MSRVRRRRLGPPTGKVLVRPGTSDAAERPSDARAANDIAVHLEDTTRLSATQNRGQGNGVLLVASRSDCGEKLQTRGQSSPVKKRLSRADASDLPQGRTTGSVYRAAARTVGDTIEGWRGEASRGKPSDDLPASRRSGDEASDPTIDRHPRGVQNDATNGSYAVGLQVSGPDADLADALSALDLYVQNFGDNPVLGPWLT